MSLRWSNYTPALTKLIKRIIDHRKGCDAWQRGESCYNCHFALLTDIENEINKITKQYIPIGNEEKYDRRCSKCDGKMLASMCIGVYVCRECGHEGY